MDEKDFKKHLKDLAHDHHHPEEHDWEPGDISVPRAQLPAKVKRAGSTAGGIVRVNWPGEPAAEQPSCSGIDSGACDTIQQYSTLYLNWLTRI
jgi:hypothetical protein